MVAAQYNPVVVDMVAVEYRDSLLEMAGCSLVVAVERNPAVDCNPAVGRSPAVAVHSHMVGEALHMMKVVHHRTAGGGRQDGQGLSHIVGVVSHTVGVVPHIAEVELVVARIVVQVLWVVLLVLVWWPRLFRHRICR